MPHINRSIWCALGMSCLSRWSHAFELIVYALASLSAQHTATNSWPFWNFGTTIVSTIFALIICMFQNVYTVWAYCNLACCTHAFVFATSSQMTFINHHPFWNFGIVTASMSMHPHLSTLKIHSRFYSYSCTWQRLLLQVNTIKTYYLIGLDYVLKL